MIQPADSITKQPYSCPYWWF